MTPTDPCARPLIGLPPEQFAAAFPFHFAVDAQLTILQVGSTLRRVCPDVRPGARLDQVFRPLRPEGSITFDWVLKNTSQFFLLHHLAADLKLRGEFVLLPGQGGLLFLGSPWLTDSAEIAARGLGFEDFAIHDSVVDLLQLFQANKAALADAKKLATKLAAQRSELRLANERLRQQEGEARKLALIAARTDNAVVLSDAMGRVIWVNEGFTRLTGYRLDEMLGRTAGSVLQGPGTNGDTVRRIREHIRNGEGFNAEILNYRKDGREYWIAIEVQPIHDEDGRLANFMAIESDITARRAAQQRLGIQYQLSQVLTETDEQSTAMTRVLQVICEQLGWHVGQWWQVAGDQLRFVDAWQSATAGVADFVDASRAMAFARGVGLPGRVWSTGRPCWIPDVTRDANFPRSPVAAREGLRGAFAFPVLLRGEAWGVLEFFNREIKEPDEGLLQTFAAVGEHIGQFLVRHEAQGALRRSEERFRLALEGADLAAWDLHIPSGVKIVNDRFLGMLGYAPGEVDLRQDKWMKHLHPDDVAQRQAAIDAHLGGQTEGYECEFRLRHKSGEWVWLLDRGRVIERDAAGSPVRVCGTHLDITFRKAAQRLLDQERKLLAEARQRELATGHEIQRTLLLGNPPEGIPGIAVASHTAPSQGIDGDFHAFTTFRPDCFELLVGDVMGKGVPAALIGAAVRTTYNEVVTELLAASLGSGEPPAPAVIVNVLHAKLTPRLIELDAFVTMALYRFDLMAGTMIWVNAGHTAGLLVGADGTIASVLGENLPVGVLPGERYVERSRPILAGDALLAYSDGLTEARNPQGAQFSEERLHDFIASTHPLNPPPNILLQALHHAVRRFAGTDQMVDDQSAVWVGVRALATDNGRPPAGRSEPEVFSLPRAAAQLGPLRTRVAAAAAFLGAGAADGLVLAAFEAATNVVRHGSSSHADSELSCRITREAARVVVELWYLGEPFQPTGEPQPDLTGGSAGGFGLYVIQHAVSEVHYENPLPDVCCTRLVQAVGARTAA